MSDPRSEDNDPSMDDILASIRKIISDDEARAQVGRGAAPGAASPGEPRPATTSKAGPSASREDVLLLTDLIEEPNISPTGARPEPPMPIPLSPAIDPVRASEMPQPTIGEPPSAPEQSLVGSTVAGAASSAFDRLNQALGERSPAPPAISPGPSLAGGGKTLEDIVKEALRPMLKEWLDHNLPPLVERLVEREIARLTRR